MIGLLAFFAGVAAWMAVAVPIAFAIEMIGNEKAEGLVTLIVLVPTFCIATIAGARTASFVAHRLGSDGMARK